MADIWDSHQTLSGLCTRILGRPNKWADFSDAYRHHLLLSFGESPAACYTLQPWYRSTILESNDKAFVPASLTRTSCFLCRLFGNRPAVVRLGRSDLRHYCQHRHKS